MLSLLEVPFLLLDALSVFALFAILAWTLYHIPILLAGLTAKEEQPQPPRSYPKLSVIIPVKDEGDRLRRLLEALFAADYPREKLEVIVVDGSGDGAGEAIARELAASSPVPIKVLRELNPRGKPAALNAALACAAGEVVAVFDADSVPERDALLRAVSRFSDPSVAAVQGSTEALNSSESIVARVASKEEKAWFQVLLRGRRRLNLFTPLTGSCQFLRADVLRALGGWPSRLAEDLELSLELFKRGYRVEYAPDAVSRQEVPKTLRSLLVQRSRWYRGYMEAALKYSAQVLLKGRRGVDAAVLSSGPYLMALCFLSVVAWLLSLIVPHQNSFSAPLTAVVALNVASLLSVSLALSLSEKPFRLRNLAWIPFIYLYWFTLTAVSFFSLLEILTARPRVWRRTPK
uniref:Glycosyltransferase family 2 protein n=1 Tax=Thermofilum pendens TaxID=2269 RepID=A0A7C4H8F3_THEPE